MCEDIKIRVLGYRTRKADNISRMKGAGLLHLQDIPNAGCEHVTADLLTELLKCGTEMIPFC